MATYNADDSDRGTIVYSVHIPYTPAHSFTMEILLIQNLEHQAMGSKKKSSTNTSHLTERLKILFINPDSTHLTVLLEVITLQ